MPTHIEPRPQIPDSPEDLERYIVRELGPTAERTVIVGSAAPYLTFGTEMRKPIDIDLAVTEEHFGELYRQHQGGHGWHTTLLPDGRPRLKNEVFDISFGWANGATYDELYARSNRTSVAGLAVANLADMSSWYQQRSEPKDIHDVTQMRDILHDSHRAPLSARITAPEIAMAQQTLPEEVRDDPELRPYIQLAANGLLTVFTLYGHPVIHRANQIIGGLELEEYLVPALYHNGFHLLDDLLLVQKHLTNIGASPLRRGKVMAAVANADKVYGYGRESDAIPGGWDERRSAELTRAQAPYFGIESRAADDIFEMIDDTGYNEKTRQQKARNHPDPDVRGVSDIDLQGLAERVYRQSSTGCIAEENVAICLEDPISRRYAKDRIFGRVLVANNVRISSFEQAMDAADYFGDARPAGISNAPTVREVIAHRLERGASFHENHRYSVGWTLDNPENRAKNAADLLYISGQYRQRGSFRRAYERITEPK